MLRGSLLEPARAGLSARLRAVRGVLLLLVAAMAVEAGSSHSRWTALVLAVLAALPYIVPGVFEVTRSAFLMVLDLAAATVVSEFVQPEAGLVLVVVALGGAAAFLSSRRAAVVGGFAVALEVGRFVAWQRDAGLEAAMTTLLRMAVYVIVLVGMRTVSDLLRQRREVLDRRQVRYRELVEDAPVPVLVVDREAILYANPAAADLLGYGGAERLVGRPTFEIVAPRERAASAEFLGRVLSGDGPRERTCEMVTADGSARIVEVAAAPFRELEHPAVQVVLNDVTARVVAERELRASEERFRTVFFESAAPFALIELDMTVAGVNRALCLLTGREEADLVGRSWASLVHRDDRKRILRAAELTSGRSPRSFTEEVRLLRADGSIVWCVLDVAVLTDADGEPSRVFALAHDVTDQRQARLALAESERRYREIFERLPVALYRTAYEGEILDANPALSNLLGFDDPAEIVGRNATEFYSSPEERFTVRDRIVNEGAAADTEMRLVRADGSEIWVRNAARFVDEGDRQYIEGALIDVTERRRAEEELRCRARQQQAVAALGQRALESTDIDAILRWSLSTVRSILDLDVVAILELGPGGVAEIRASRGWEDPPRSVDGALARRTAATAAPLVLRTVSEVRLAAPELAARGLVSGVSLVIGGSERPFGILWGFCRHERRFHTDDVNFLLAVTNVLAAALERHRARSRLEELVRSKDDFVATVSHELRTPLTVVAGMAHELAERWEGFDRDELDELLSLIVDQSREMTDLIEDLLVAARADIGKVSIHPERVQLAEQVERVVAVLPLREIRRVEVGGEDAAVLADPVRLRQVLRNLLTNAVRYGGPNIRVTSGVDAGTAWVRVIDDGPGVPPEDRDRIFEPYQRAHAAVGRPGSVGLGLTVSRKLAELMGGTLAYRREDGLSVFELSLPTLRTVAEEIMAG